jgi:hypothetical protein
MSVDENYSEKKPMTTQDILRLSAEELHHRLAQGETVTVLDVRTEDALSVQPRENSRIALAATAGRSGTCTHAAASGVGDYLLYLTRRSQQRPGGAVVES